MFQTIVAGVDGSPESIAGASWAADEAALRGRELHLIHVRETHEAPGRPLAGPERGRRLLAELADGFGRLHPALRVQTAEPTGDAVAALCAAADRAELTVLGSRGLGGLAGFVAGSVSLGVLARVRRPVVLVRARPRPAPQAPPGQGGEVVAGVDQDGMDDVLGFAFHAADRYGCGLQAVHTWSLPGLYGPDLAGCTSLILDECTGEHGRAMDDALASWAGKYPAVPVRRLCCQGRAAVELVDASRHARVVVVGRRNRPGRGRIGPVTHAVVRHAESPVAVVPHD